MKCIFTSCFFSYKSAEKHFIAAYSRVKSMKDLFFADKWEPLLNNLGHTYRKLKKYEESLEFHHKVMIFKKWIIEPINTVHKL